jgi:hypothetical protein
MSGRRVFNDYRGLIGRTVVLNRAATADEIAGLARNGEQTRAPDRWFVPRHGPNYDKNPAK